MSLALWGEKLAVLVKVQSILMDHKRIEWSGRLQSTGILEMLEASRTGRTLKSTKRLCFSIGIRQ